MDKVIGIGGNEFWTIEVVQNDKMFDLRMCLQIVSDLTIISKGQPICDV